MLFSAAFVAFYFVFGRFSRFHNGRGALFFSEAILLATFFGSLCMGYFDNPILDGLSSGRVSMASDLVNSFTLQDWLFGYGQPVWIDNSYLKILASCGLPGTLCLLAFLAVSMRGLSVTGNAERLAFLCASLVLGVLESVLFRPEIMISIIFWGIVFCGPESSKNSSGGGAEGDSAPRVTSGLHPRSKHLLRFRREGCIGCDEEPDRS